MSAPKILLCPQCGETTQWKDNPTRPFCSERCQLIDLGNWADEKYSIPLGSSPHLPEDEED